MRNAECGVRNETNAECGMKPVRSAECGMRNKKRNPTIQLRCFLTNNIKSYQAADNYETTYYK